VLEQILATSHAEPTATETWETYHPHQPVPVGRSPSAAGAEPLDHRPATDPRWTGAGPLTHVTQPNREGEPS